MNRTRALVISLAVAVAAIAGVLAVGQTASLGAGTRNTSDTQVDRRAAQLDRFEASLRKALAQQPSPLPAVPPSTAAPSSSTPPSTAPVRVVFNRPPPVVVTAASSNGEEEHEDEHGEENESEHGEENESEHGEENELGHGDENEMERESDGSEADD